MSTINDLSFYRLQNVWHRDIYIQGGNSGIGLGPSGSNGEADQWKIIPVEKDWVRIQNRQIPAHFIHDQNGQIEAGPIQLSWTSSMWKIIPIGSGMNRIQNRQNEENYINNQPDPFSILEAGPIEVGWNSAMWTLVQSTPEDNPTPSSHRIEEAWHHWFATSLFPLIFSNKNKEMLKLYEDRSYLVSVLQNKNIGTGIPHF